MLYWIFDRLKIRLQKQQVFYLKMVVSLQKRTPQMNQQAKDFACQC